MTPRKALQEACQKAGSKTKLALALEVTPSTVTNWFYRRKPIPAERAIDIEKATGVPRAALRPDLWVAE